MFLQEIKTQVMDSEVAAGFVGGIQVSIFRRGTVSDEDFYYFILLLLVNSQWQCCR